MSLLVRLKMATVCIFVYMLTASGCLKSDDPGLPPAVQNALSLANLNRPELMRAILAFDSPKDSIKREALYFLLSNLPQQYTIYVSLVDSANKPVDFNPLDLTPGTSVKHYFDSLSQVVGEIRYRADSFNIDLKKVTANFLIQHVNQAYANWKQAPWSQAYTFKEFTHWILPYRVANEPTLPFRQHFLEKFRDTIKSFSEPKDAVETVNQIINNEIACDDRFSPNPNPQSFSQLEKSALGSSLDLAMYKVYALRSLGIAACMDYCPFYSDSVGGIYTATALLPDGRWLNLPPKEKPIPFPVNTTPKVFRRSFAHLNHSLYSIKNISDHTPPFLGHFDYLDVTKDYVPVKDVVLEDVQSQSKYLYLAVDNDEEWKAVEWAIPDSTGRAIFHNMGKNQRYRLVEVGENEMRFLTEPF